MNTVPVKLRFFSVLLVKGSSLSAAPPPVARCPSSFHRTVSQFVRAMSTDNHQDARQPPGLKRARQKEPLRRVKTKENRSRRGDVHGPSTVYVQVIGAGSRDNAASLYVFSEYNR